MGLNPQLRWLTTVCLRGFDRNVQQLLTVFSLHQYLQRAVMNERKQLSFSNHHSRVPRLCLISLKSRFDVRLECQVIVLSKLNFKKMCMQKVLIFEKTKICSPAGFEPECKSVALPIEPYGCGFGWNVARVFSTSSSMLITAFTHGDKLEVGRWWVYDINQLICRCGQSHVSYQRDERTDGRFYIYRIEDRYWADSTAGMCPRKKSFSEIS